MSTPIARRLRRLAPYGAMLVICGLLTIPAFLVPPGVGVFRVLVVVGELAVVLAILSVRPRSRRVAYPLLAALGLGAVLSVLAFAATVALAPVFGLAGLGAAILGYLVLPGPRVRRVLAGWVVGGSIAAQLLVLATAWLQIASYDADRARTEACVQHDVQRPGRRYHFAVDASGTHVASFFPQAPKTEIHAVTTGPSQPEEVLHEIGPNRVARAPYRGRLIALDYGRGLMAFDPETLDIAEPPAPELDRSYFMGLGIRRSVDELLVLHGDGWLQHVDGRTWAETERVDLLSDTWIRFNEEMHSAYLAPDERRLVVVKNGGRLLVYDAEERRVVATRHLFEPTGNVVFRPGGDRAVVATMFSGRLLELDVDDLAVLRTRWLGPGTRYIREIGDDHLAAGNYIDGELQLLEIRSGEVVARAITGPRIQWLETSGGGDVLWVSHGEGLTAFDVPCLLRGGHPEADDRWVLQERISPPALVRDFRWEGAPDATALVSVVLLLAIGALLVRRRAGSPG